MSEVREKALQARQAARVLAQLSSAARDTALVALANALNANVEHILAANDLDIAEARAGGTPEPLIDRLALSPERIAEAANGLLQISRQPDPLGRVLEGRRLANGLRLQKVSVPLGVIGMIYEARPNVTVDAAGLCLKSGNAVILRGGSMALRSNLAVTDVLTQAGAAAGLPNGWLASIETSDRSATTELMGLHGLIDLLVPRGSASLIRATVEQSKVPVIETGEGNCHLYVHEAADPETVIPIALNAKTQRPGVCNAIETILVDRSVAAEYIPALLQALIAAGVKVHADTRAGELAKGLTAEEQLSVVALTAEDWGREYLDLEVALGCVDGLDAAIEHINQYTTHHSEAILSTDYAAVQRFLAEIDAAAVYANASTRFTDGGQFGLGAELGISTQKLHARGPMGIEALTSSKYICEGSGQVR
ncbi:MAG: glutamate-5-semialdehyde dehydrogenase [Coriobacteriia bacterium]|nr:glutamate-5-semialdehyde dehydrogenase [Coriobacteriia bacterium]